MLSSGCGRAGATWVQLGVRSLVTALRGATRGLGSEGGGIGRAVSLGGEDRLRRAWLGAGRGGHRPPSSTAGQTASGPWSSQSESRTEVRARDVLVESVNLKGPVVHEARAEGASRVPGAREVQWGGRRWVTGLGSDEALEDSRTQTRAGGTDPRSPAPPPRYAGAPPCPVLCNAVAPGTREKAETPPGTAAPGPRPSVCLPGVAAPRAPAGGTAGGSGLGSAGSGSRSTF